MSNLKVFILIPNEYTDIMQFRFEFSKAINLYQYYGEYTEHEYIYLDTKNSDMIENSFNLLNLKQKKIQPLWRDNKVGLLNFDELIDSYIEDGFEILVIEFQDLNNIPNFKKKFYKKYTKKVNFYLAYYVTYYQELKCCDQELTYLNEELDLDNDIFDFFKCEVCHTYFALLQELLDEFTLKGVELRIIYRRNYLKGEY